MRHPLLDLVWAVCNGADGIRYRKDLTRVSERAAQAVLRCENLPRSGRHMAVKLLHILCECGATWLDGSMDTWWAAETRLIFRPSPRRVKTCWLLRAGFSPGRDRMTHEGHTRMERVGHRIERGAVMRPRMRSVVRSDLRLRARYGARRVKMVPTAVSYLRLCS